MPSSPMPITISIPPKIFAVISPPRKSVSKVAAGADKPPNGDFCRKLPFYLLLKPVNRNSCRSYRDKKSKVIPWLLSGISVKTDR